MKQLKDLFGTKYQTDQKGQVLKKNFTVNRPQTLFGEDWSALKQSRCPYCFNRLSYLPTKKLYRCKSKKHRKTFVIGLEKLKRYSHPISSQ